MGTVGHSETKGATLDIDEGSFVIVIGTNGSGKSTLLNAAAGTFPIDHGTFTLSGRDVARWPEHRRAAMIGRVFQNPFSGTAPNMTVAEKPRPRRPPRPAPRTRSPATNKAPRRTARPRRHAQHATRIVDEQSHRHPLRRPTPGPHTININGHWRRPDLLLLDEHTAAFDPKSADQIVRLTQRIVSQHRLTTLMVTHSMQQAATLGDRIVMMNQGRIHADIGGAEKRRIRAEDLVRRFEEIRREEQLDVSAAEMLREVYV